MSPDRSATLCFSVPRLNGVRMPAWELSFQIHLPDSKLIARGWDASVYGREAEVGAGPEYLIFDMRLEEEEGSRHRRH